ALLVAALAGPAANAATTQINLAGAGGTVTGGGVFLNSLFDVTRFSGMFIIRDFDPTGFTGTVGFDRDTSDNGVEFLLHLNTLESFEAVILRTSDSPRSDELTEANDQLLLPRTAAYTGPGGTGFFGSGSVTFENGVLVGFEYRIGPEALASYDFLFDGAGIDASLEEIVISSGPIALGSNFIVDGADPNATTPYGLNSNGYVTPETDNTTTRFEASDPNLCTQIYVADICLGVSDPLNAGIGLNPFTEGDDLYLYELGGLTSFVSAVPLPAAFWFLGSALAGLALGARKKTA
ncbi:MAG: VPLPA-CTERM sorting domain-containing protein, partial [Pseudomonadota bacterium]